MTREEFDKLYLDKVVHCDTEEKANEFLALADSFGYKWKSGKSLIEENFWEEYKKETCYYTRNDGISFGNTNHSRLAYYQIIEYQLQPKINEIQFGDAYELIKNIPDKSVDLIYTDPPYKIGTGGMTGLFKRPNRKNGGIYMKEIIAGGFHDGFDMTILDEFVRVMKFINIYIWCNKEQLREYLNYFNDKNCNFEIIIWAKPTFPPFTNGHFCKDKELCLYFWEKNKIKITGSWEEMKTIIKYPINNEDKNDYGHPTIKPLMEVMQRIKTSTNENDLVLDPFMGSGTTAVACKELNRNFIGFEINEKYHKIATDRLNGIKKNGQTSLLDTDFDLL